MNQQSNSAGYHPTHLLSALLVVFSTGSVLFQEQPWGWPMAVAGGLAVVLAILLSRPPLDPGCWTALAVTAFAVATPLLSDHPLLKVIIWGLAALGSGFYTMNLMYGAAGIPDRGLTAFLSAATVVAAGVLVNLVFRADLPWVWWVTWMVGGPAIGALFGRFAKVPS